MPSPTRWRFVLLLALLVFVLLFGGDSLRQWAASLQVHVNTTQTGH